MLAVDESVGERAAAVRAESRQRPQSAITEPEHRDLLIIDGEGAALAEGDLISRTEPAQPHPGYRAGHRAGTWGNSSSGSALRNWPSVTGCRCSCQGSR